MEILIASSMKPTISIKLFSFIPREVSAGVPENMIDIRKVIQ